VIITKEVIVRITNRNRKLYNLKGYNTNLEHCTIKIEDVSNFSHCKIDVKCELCNKNKSITYFKYWKNKNNYGIYSCSNKCSMIKNQKTCLNKYGFIHQNMDKDIKNKIIKTKIENGIISYNHIDYGSYRRVVDNYTNLNKKELFNRWDGVDYYDGSYIRNNYNLHFNDDKYPSIDHKISVLYGFNNNISPEEISNVENLCITTRINNSTKNSLNEISFKMRNPLTR
jgi:hypothetical protein